MYSVGRVRSVPVVLRRLMLQLLSMWLLPWMKIALGLVRWQRDRRVRVHVLMMNGRGEDITTVMGRALWGDPPNPGHGWSGNGGIGRVESLSRHRVCFHFVDVYIGALCASVGPQTT